MIELNKKIAQCEPDDLVVGTYPPCRAGGGYLVAGSGDLPRGTILAKNAEGKLEVLGKSAGAETDGISTNSETNSEGETPEVQGKTTGAKAYGILTDPVKNSEEEIPVTVYISGKFNSNKVSVAKGYTITEDDLDTLRAYGIELTAAMKN